MVKKNITNGEESKDNRFKRIASRRVQDILHKMRLLGNCANKSVYAYSEEDKKKIFSAIDEEWRKVKLEFNKGTQASKEFNL